jgi:predicted amidophosphoribosyltransferase
MKLLKQECEEGNIPEPLCPPEWRPSNKIAEVRSPRQTEQYASEPVFEEQPAPQDFQKVEISHNCPECGSRIESEASRCKNCLVKLEWQFGTPKVAEEKMSEGEERPFIAVQSRSSF